VETAVAIAEELTFDVPWQAGDAVLVDNFVVMHGRRTFRGTRKVLASLAEPQTHDTVGSVAETKPTGAIRLSGSVRKMVGRQR